MYHRRRCNSAALSEGYEMKSIKAADLKVGMDTDSGFVEDLTVLANGKVDVTFSIHDQDCGETDYFPCILDPNEMVGLSFY